VERAPPRRPALERLIRAHLAMVPFENVTSILRRYAHQGTGPVPAVDPEAQLRLWESRAGGGVCFEVAEMFSTLVTALGYHAYPVVGTVLASPSPWLGGHQATVVELNGRGYLADPGNGAPFYEPAPLDRPLEVHRAGLSYRFRPDDEPGRLLQERMIDGAWTAFCAYDLRRPESEARLAAFQRHHQLDQSWVASSLFMIRCADDAVHVVRDGTWTRYTDQGKESVPLTSDGEYVRLATEVFGLPALPIERALRVLAERGGV
jgi:arylamine N-acetyltransferase